MGRLAPHSHARGSVSLHNTAKLEAYKSIPALTTASKNYERHERRDGAALTSTAHLASVRRLSDAASQKTDYTPYQPGPCFSAVAEEVTEKVCIWMWAWPSSPYTSR